DASTPVANLAHGGHSDELGRREAIELFTAYRAQSDPAVRRRLQELARALGSEPNGPTAKASASQSRRPRARCVPIEAVARRGDRTIRQPAAAIAIPMTI